MGFESGSDNDINESNSHAGKRANKSGKAGKSGFQSMGLSGPIFRSIMKRGYRVPTPIQRKCIPAILTGRDLVAMARTGSGKTASFLIPIMEKLKEHATVVGARAVILSPTRELALQTSKYTRDLGKFTDLRHCLLLGGDSMEEQFEALSCNPDLIIATPGRLCHVAKTAGISLKAVEFAVFDEADRLFEMGFASQLRQILDLMSDTRQTLLFSATMPRVLADFTQAGLNTPQIIRLDTEAKISPSLQNYFLAIRPDQKLGGFMHLMQNTIDRQHQTLVFACTRHHVEFLHRMLTDNGFSSTLIYGAMDASARKINLGKFRAGRARILVVTDVAARGLDLPLLDNVVNFHFPSSPKLFIHRVGRVARAGRSGSAYSLVEPAECPYMLDLCLYLGMGFPSTAHTGTTPNTDDSSQSESDTRLQFGSMPSGPVDQQTENCKRQISHTNDLISMERVCERAYKLYCKTRSGASPSSVRSAKEPAYCLRTLLLHTIYRDEKSSEQDQYQNLLAGIRGYKAKGTVFEIGKQDAVMKEMRQVHGAQVDLHRQARENVDPEFTKSFRDESNFISAGTSNEHPALGAESSIGKPARITDLMMDVNGDDAETMNKLKTIRRWDQKKKKFVRLGSALDQQRDARNEAGAKIVGKNVKPSDVYEKWCSKSKKSIPQVGSTEQSHGQSMSGLINSAGGRFANRSSNASSTPSIPKLTGGNKRARDELKSAEQIGKERAKKAKIAQRNSSSKKPTGNKKGNKKSQGKHRR